MLFYGLQIGVLDWNSSTWVGFKHEGLKSRAARLEAEKHRHLGSQFGCKVVLVAVFFLIRGLLPPTCFTTGFVLFLNVFVDLFEKKTVFGGSKRGFCCEYATTDNGQVGYIMHSKNPKGQHQKNKKTVMPDIRGWSSSP